MTPHVFRPWPAPAILAAVLALGGCASAPLEEIAKAHATVAWATPASRGAADLARAEGKLALSRRWMDARDHGPARWLAEQAQVDAELAFAKSAAEAARRTATMPLPSHVGALQLQGGAI